MQKNGVHVSLQTPLGQLSEVTGSPWPQTFANCDTRGQCDVLLRADDIVHDDNAPVKAEIIRKAFRGSEFLYTLRVKDGQMLMAHVPSHHDHKLGDRIGIKAEVDHVVTFAREAAALPENS